MIPLHELVRATAAHQIINHEREPQTRLAGFAHDSRTADHGDCFVAVRGIHGDGHDYLRDAVEHGAAALLVQRDRLADLSNADPELVGALGHAGAVLLVVDDTRAALRAYAAHILRLWCPTVIAVTGSSGKTTTKEAIADILSTQAPTFRSWRNYNDLLGLPLSLGRLEPTHRYAVVEMAADHPGEIEQLCQIAHPTIGVVTNVSPTHLQYFAGLDALQDELAALPAALPEAGVAILYADDPATAAMQGSTPARVRWFGLAENAGASLATTPSGVGYSLASDAAAMPGALALRRCDTGDVTAFPHLVGDHWRTSVLAALAVAEEFGVAPELALNKLSSLQPLEGRMRRLEGIDGMVLIDDSHNATPAGVEAGLIALDKLGRQTNALRVAVLGDMLRLDHFEMAAHQAAGHTVREHADYLVTKGPIAEHIAAAAVRAGMPSAHVTSTHTAEDAANAVRALVASDDDASERGNTIVYIKGSEELRMEQVTERLLARPELAEAVLDRQTLAWRRFIVMQPERPTWLEIDLSAIGRNTRLIKQLVGTDVQVLASLKADAYGHGALRVARTVLHNGASWLGVASLNEAQSLRAARIDAPTLIFGYLPAWQAREAVRLDLRATVYDMESALALSRAAADLGRSARVHLKVDTGMGRLGLRAEDVSAVVEYARALVELPAVEFEGIFTHFATADSRDQTYARRQLDRFNAVLAALEERGLRPPLVHAANSAALLTLPEARFDMVRSGIALYGLAPSDEIPLPAGFQPALTFKTQVAQVKEIPAGEGISYGATFVTSAPTRVAVLPVGYADGFRRAPRNWGEVLVRGQRAPILGRVCMDQCMVDVTDISGVHQGDEVVLIGQQGNDELTAEAVAERLGTIAYEVVAELLARVPRMT